MALGCAGRHPAPSRLRVGCSSPCKTSRCSPGSNIVNFTATASGDLHNLPVGAPVDLKTSIPGVTASLAASGPPVTFGTGNASLLLFAAQDGVEVLIQDPMAALQPLTVVASIPPKRVTITLGTDGASALNSTAAQVRQALADAIKVPQPTWANSCSLRSSAATELASSRPRHRRTSNGPGHGSSRQARKSSPT